MSAESNKAVIRGLIEFLNKNNGAPAEGFDQFFAPGYRYHNPSLPEVTDLAGIKKLNATLASAFSDTRFAIEDLIAEEDKVVYRCSVSSIHTGDFMGIAATGRRTTVNSTVVSRIVDGKLQEDWEVADILGLLQTIGLIPQLGSQIK